MNITLITHPLSDAVSAATGYRWFDANARFYRLVQRADLKPRASIVAPSGNTRLTHERTEPVCKVGKYISHR